MKKLMIAAVALCMSASAMAEWVVVEQTENGAVMQENALGVSFAVQQVAASGTAPIADIATEYAKNTDSFAVIHDDNLGCIWAYNVLYRETAHCTSSWSSAVVFLSISLRSRSQILHYFKIVRRSNI